MCQAYPEWHPEFKYHGLNCYALLLAKYGTSGDQPTFDLVDIQLYESWAHAGKHWGNGLCAKGRFTTGIKRTKVL